MEILILLAGLLYFYTWHSYCLIFILLACIYFKRFHYILIFLIAMAYGWLHNFMVFSELVTDKQVIPMAIVTGKIVSVPKSYPYKTQFNFRVQSLNGQKANTLVLLSWYRSNQKLEKGQEWRFRVKLKKPRNLANPGSFDYVQWLRSKHLSWTGYVKGSKNILISQSRPQFSLSKIRQQLKNRLQESISNKEALAIIQALSLGYTDNITQSLKDLFQRSGISHLMVISGAHIGLVMGMAYAIVLFLWKRLGSLPLYYPAQKAASLFGFAFAFLYALLAGFAVPAQRAVVGCALFSLQYFINKKMSAWQIWRYALFIVLLIEPHAALSRGLYLSFFAVAIILFANQSWQHRGIKKLFLMQASILIGLMPLSFYWFSYASITGFIVNLFAIPLVGLVLVPLSLLIIISINSSWFGSFVWLSDSILSLFLMMLKFVDKWSFVNITLSINSLLTVLIIFAFVYLYFYYPNKKGVLASLSLIVLIFLPNSKSIPKGEAIIRVLDVGQGLSVVVHTAQHNLVYDFGDKFYSGNNMGDMVVLPYLKTQGVNTLDKIILSHPDKDHSGGMAAMMKSTRVKEIIVNDRRLNHSAKNCHYYPDWNWDGVNFHFLAIRKRMKGKNNRSCVLQIITIKSTILLTGDIEQKAEEYLQKQYGKNLKSDILLVPHHGSKTSSSSEFLQTVKPQFAIASLGFDNRYRFPHKRIIERYRQKHVPLIMTKDCGMTTVSFENQYVPSCYKTK